jgi:hypothetical protein
MKSRYLLFALLTLSLCACGVKPTQPYTAPLVNQCPAGALEAPPLPPLEAPDNRADNVVAQDIKDKPLWEATLNILKAAQDCLKTLQAKGILRTATPPKPSSQ